MNNVVSLDAQRPHITGPAKCMCCAHKWQSVAQVGTTELECPKCGTNKGRFINAVVRGDYGHWTCKCGNDLFHVTPAGNYCPNCGIWHDPLPSGGGGARGMSKISPDTLRQLRAEEEKATADLQAAKDQQSAAGRRVTTAANRVEEIRRRLAEVSSPLHVTDHALLRLLERKYEIPVDDLRTSFAEVVKKYAGVGDGRFPIGDGMLAVVKNSAVVTVVPK